MKKIAVCTSFLFLFMFCVCRGQSQSRYIPKQDLLDDIDNLYAGINDIHPHMFSVISRQEFEKKLDRLKISLKDSMTVFEFYKQVSPLVSAIQDGHTELSFPFGKLMEYGIRVFPFFLHVNKTDTVITVLNDWSAGDEKIPAGATILSINGRGYKDVAKECLDLLSGELHHFKVARLKYLFPFLLYPVLNDIEFTIAYGYNGKVFHKEMQGMPAAQYFENVQRFFVNEYTFTIDEQTKSAVIRFDEFGYDKEVFKKFLDSTFLLLKNRGITDLIIDLRNNGGGSSARVDEFFQYISPVPFRQFDKTIVKISDPVKQRYEEPKKDLYIMEDQLVGLIDNPLRFKGDIYLLASNFTFSSATSFAAAFQYFKMGKIVGEETGGLVACYGNVFDYKLEKSGLNYGVSWHKYYKSGASDQSTRGVKPDYPVAANEAMDKAIELISNKK